MTHRSENQFQELFLEFMDLVVAKDSYELNDSRDGSYEQLVGMIADNLVAPSDVIQIFSFILAKYNTFKNLILQFMRSVVVISTRNDSYSYPEFLWLIIESGLLSDIDNINDILPSLIDISSTDIMRGYLNTLIFTQSEEKLYNTVRALYYVGYTVQSLKFVVHRVPFTDESIELYDYIYSNVMSLTYEPKASSLDDDEKTYLKEFFTQGLNTSHLGIVKNSQTALSQLDKL